MIALSLMLLAGYGGMVSLAQMTVAGIAGYMVAILGATTRPCSGFGWPWWIAVPLAHPDRRRLRVGADRLLAVRTAGIYTIMITLAIATALLLLRPAELRDLQRPSAASPASRRRMLFGVDWRDADALLLSVRSASPRSAMPPCSMSRARPSGWRCRRSATIPGACARSASMSTAHRVAAYAVAGLIAALGRRAARLVQRPHLARHDRRRPADRHPGHRRRRRPAPSDRPVHRRALLRAARQTFAIDIVGAERFNTLIGLVFLVDRAVFARRRCWACGRKRAALSHQERRLRPAS